MSKSRPESRLESRVLRLARTYFDISRPLIEEMFAVDISQVEIKPFSEYPLLLKKLYGTDPKIKEHCFKYSKCYGFFVNGENSEKIFINPEVVSQQFNILDVITHEAMHAVHHKINPSLDISSYETLLEDTCKPEELIHIEGFATYMTLNLMFTHLSNYRLAEKQENLEKKNLKEESKANKINRLFAGLQNEGKLYANFGRSLPPTFSACEESEYFKKTQIAYKKGYFLFNAIAHTLGFEGIKKALRNPPTSELQTECPAVYVEYLRKCS